MSPVYSLREPESLWSPSWTLMFLFSTFTGEGEMPMIFSMMYVVSLSSSCKPTVVALFKSYDDDRNDWTVPVRILFLFRMMTIQLFQPTLVLLLRIEQVALLL